MVVTEGETVSGWRVDSITPREVSLSGPGGTKTLQPKIDPNLTPSATPHCGASNHPAQPVAGPAAGAAGISADAVQPSAACGRVSSGSGDESCGD